MTKDKVPVKYFESVEQGDSGFVMDGTERTPFEQRLRTPTVSWIPTDGIEVYLDENGIKRHRPIRHIKNCESIYPLEQEKMGFKPNRTNDKIPMDQGFLTIRREGSTVSTYDYLNAATYFLDNPLRPQTATPIYKEIKADERAVELIDDDELLTVAKSKVYALRLNTGKDAPYRYDENKIDSYCRLLNVWDETPERKLVLLLNKAMTNPNNFLQTIVKAEQTVITEVSHALQLNVIAFDANTAQYTKESKVIYSVGKGNMSESKKIEALSNWLQTTEGNTALTELRTNLEVAKELQFKQ